MKKILLISIIALSTLLTACQESKQAEVVVPEIKVTELATSNVQIPVNNVNEITTQPEEFEPVFTSSEITDELFARINGSSFKDGCDISLEDLRYLQISYIGFDQLPHDGELICNKQISDDLLTIFQTLYENNYEIESVELVDEFGGDDEASMEANNTSCFNYRTISGSKKLSKHSLGMAIDINPLYNPCIKKVNGTTAVAPSTGYDYINRDEDFPHKIDKNDLAYQLFTEHGFSWGGSWTTTKDYQHFEKRLAYR